MDLFMQGVQIVLGAAGLYFVVCATTELGRIRYLLEHPARGSRPHVSSRVHLPSAQTPCHIYAIWVWRGNHWDLDLATVPKGYRALQPPPYPGSFHEQRVKAECDPC